MVRHTTEHTPPERRSGARASAAQSSLPAAKLSEREAAVLRAIVAAHVGEAAPIGSSTIAQLLPVSISSASIRSVLASLMERGLVEQPHTSAGRVPTEEGLRLFVDQLLDPEGPAAYEKRSISFSMDSAPADSVVNVASQLLSERTHQLGFVVAPRIDRVVLRHLSLVRLTTEQILVVLVSEAGSAHRCVLADDGDLSQPELDRVATLLNERVAGRCLREVRTALEREARTLRHQADRLLAKVVELGRRALAAADDDRADLVIATRLALLDQPEFRDPRLLRDLFEAIETKERMLDVLGQVLDDDGVRVAFGAELDDPALRNCAVVAARYGDGPDPLGALGVIGPRRMDFRRVIPLVDYFSRAVTEKLSA